MIIKMYFTNKKWADAVFCAPKTPFASLEAIEGNDSFMKLSSDKPFLRGVLFSGPNHEGFSTLFLVQPIKTAQKKVVFESSENIRDIFLGINS